MWINFDTCPPIDFLKYLILTLHCRKVMIKYWSFFHPCEHCWDWVDFGQITIKDWHLTTRLLVCLSTNLTSGNIIFKPVLIAHKEGQLFLVSWGLNWSVWRRFDNYMNILIIFSISIRLNEDWMLWCLLKSDHGNLVRGHVARRRRTGVSLRHWKLLKSGHTLPYPICSCICITCSTSKYS